MSLRAQSQTESVVSANELLHASSRAPVVENDQEDPHCSCILTSATALSAVWSTDDGEATVPARKFCFRYFMQLLLHRTRLKIAERDSDFPDQNADAAP